jgi:DNA-directed RNA polymerase specialized sigma24 family protein
VDQLEEIGDPAALPGWLATTTRRECCRVLREARGPQAPGSAPDMENIPGQQGGIGEDELLVSERRAALREAFASLPPSCQQLLALLTADPPLSAAEISAKLGIPGDSIVSARSRCLDKLRSHPAITCLRAAPTSAPRGSGGRRLSS